MASEWQTIADVKLRGVWKSLPHARLMWQLWQESRRPHSLTAIDRDMAGILSRV
jgi:hypothetical protein